MSLKFKCLGLRVTYPVIKITDLKICILARFIPFHIFTQTSFLNSLCGHTCKTNKERYPPLYKHTLLGFSSKPSNNYRTGRTPRDFRELCRDCVVRAVTQEIRTKHTDRYDCVRLYSEFVGGICGPSSDNPENVQCVIIAKCDKDIKAHLRSYKVLDSSLHTEARLLLARAGKL